MSTVEHTQHAARASSFFEQRAPTAIIFGSFGAVFLPLLMLVLYAGESQLTQHALFVHGVGLGLTHFLITFALYFQSSHLDHFRSSGRNRALYLGLPAAILALFALAAVLDVRSQYPVFAALALGAVRFFDFFHVGRQSFGMLQLFKGSLASRDAAGRRGEDRFFVALACAQWVTFAFGGRFDARSPWMVAIAVALLGGFASLCTRYMLELRAGADASARRALAYLALQAFSGACAVYDTRLYVVGLTLHYVEYHVIMAPRCMRAPLDATRFSDRLFGRIRSNALLFSGALFGAAVLVHAAGNSSSRSSFVHLFDGIFLAHYVVEAFLWRFREPFYRERVAPLYRVTTVQSPSDVPAPTHAAPLAGASWTRVQ